MILSFFFCKIFGLGAVKKKGCKEESTGSRASPPPSCNSCNGRKNAVDNLEMRRRGGIGEQDNENGTIHHDFDSDSLSHSPTGSSVLGGTDSGTNFTASSASSSSSSSGGCCSGSITEEEEGDDNCLDDWEAMADALAANDDNKQENQKDNPCLESESSPEHEPSVLLDTNSANLGSTCQNLNQAWRPVPPTPRLAPGNSRAWRPDDAFRPQSLPNLSKQLSLPSTNRLCGRGGHPAACSSALNVPSSCPICTEDLDFTDASFLPCSCGFRLCLFCHNKILEQDGRCPNCRKLYEHDPVEVEASVHGGSLTLRLARSCSMVARS